MISAGENAKRWGRLLNADFHTIIALLNTSIGAAASWYPTAAIIGPSMATAIAVLFFFACWQLEVTVKSRFKKMRAVLLLGIPPLLRLSVTLWDATSHVRGVQLFWLALVLSLVDLAVTFGTRARQQEGEGRRLLHDGHHLVDRDPIRIPFRLGGNYACYLNGSHDMNDGHLLTAQILKNGTNAQCAGSLLLKGEDSFSVELLPGKYLLVVENPNGTPVQFRVRLFQARQIR